MCHSYYLDLKTTAWGKKLLEKAKTLGLDRFALGDIYPGKKILILKLQDGKLIPDIRTWGISYKNHKVINGRYESLDKVSLFVEDVSQYCLIPSSAFHEYKAKKRYSLTLNNKEIFFLAGLCNDEKAVILTKAPGAYFAQLHERCPLPLDKENMMAYLEKGRIIALKETDFNIIAD